jgi:hypothetical protein
MKWTATVNGTAISQLTNVTGNYNGDAFNVSLML